MKQQESLEYTLCEALSSNRLIELVNGFINKGWTPLGSIAITGEYHGTLVYCQALIKEKFEVLEDGFIG